MTTMYLSPLPVQQFTDNNGNLLAGGQLFLFAAGTTTPQAAYTDSAGGTPLPNPVILNSRGEVAPSAVGTSCGLWLNPTLGYKIVLAPANDTNPPTNPFWMVDQVVSPQAAILAALAEYEASLAGVPIGSMIAFGGATAPGGWILCYGQAVSRTTYAALFAVIGTAYGGGDGSSTFNLPDMRGRYPIGADNMGGAAANRVTEAGSSVDATALGHAGGTQLAQTDTLSATTTVTSTDSGHNHPITPASIETNVPPASNRNTSFSGAFGEAAITIGTGNANITSVATTTVTSQLAGSSQNMPPCQVVNYILYAGA